MKTRFTKIKYDGTKVRIEYTVEREKGKAPDEYALVSCDSPLPSFSEAIGALTDDVLAICELPEEQRHKIKVRGVSLTHTNDVLGACVTALKAVRAANAPLVLNTPHLPQTGYSDNADEPVMPDGMAERIAAVCAEAQRYVDGERSQASLFGVPEGVTLTTFEPAVAH
jgi:hypothetical protein